MITDERGSIRLEVPYTVAIWNGEAERNSIRESKLSFTTTFFTGFLIVGD